jgi:hypothetical protein
MAIEIDIDKGTEMAVRVYAIWQDVAVASAPCAVLTSNCHHLWPVTKVCCSLTVTIEFSSAGVFEITN